MSEKLNTESVKLKNYMVNNHLQDILDTILEFVYTVAPCL